MGFVGDLVGGAVKGIGSIAKTVASPLKALAPVVSMIPGVGPIAGGLASVLGAAGGGGSTKDILTAIGQAVPGVIGGIRSEQARGRELEALQQQMDLLRRSSTAAQGILDQGAPLRSAASSSLLQRLQAGMRPMPDLAYLRDTQNPFTARFTPPAGNAASRVPSAGAIKPNFNIAAAPSAGAPGGGSTSSLVNALRGLMVPQPSQQPSNFSAKLLTGFQAAQQKAEAARQAAAGTPGTGLAAALRRGLNMARAL